MQIRVLIIKPSVWCRWASELIIYWLQRSLDDLAWYPLTPEDELAVQMPLPDPMFHVSTALCLEWAGDRPAAISAAVSNVVALGCCCRAVTLAPRLSLASVQGNYQSAGDETCMMGEHFRTLVTAKDDAWQWVNEGDEVKQKVGGDMHIWACWAHHARSHIMHPATLPTPDGAVGLCQH